MVVVCADGVSAVSKPDEPKMPEVSENIGKAAALYRQFKTHDAIRELERVLEHNPDNLEALVWSARAYIDLGDMIPEAESEWERKRKERYRTAERYAEKAVEVDPNSTWGHFYLAVAMAKIAALSSTKKQIELAHEIRERVDKSLALDPDNGYAYHLLGVWHRRMAEIGGTKRFMALVFMQGSVPHGSMEKAVHYLKKAVSYNPGVITHHLELAKTYKAIGETELAKKHLEKVQVLPIRFSDDSEHKRDARSLLQEINGNGAQ